MAASPRSAFRARGPGGAAPARARRARLRAGARLAAGCSLLALVLWGCAESERPLPENTPPLTYLAVTGESLSVVNYHIILNWGGTDRDGFVAGYAYRWDGAWQPAADDSLWWEDSTWTFTAATRDTFDVPVAGSFAERIFSVRAIDDDLLADPHPREQRFRLANYPPIVSWTDPARHPTLARPSLPAVSFAWTPEDYDGRETVAAAHLWLDTQPGEDSALARIVVQEDTVAALFVENFQGRYGRRTVYLQVFDLAATASDTISWTWNVVAPAGEYLLIDNAWPANSAAARIDDEFWRARMNALFPGNVHLYNVETEGAFRSAPEALALFHLFKGVVWYGMHQGGEDQNAAMRLCLSRAQSIVLPYLEENGRLLVAALNLIGTDAGWTTGFCTGTLGLGRIYTYRLEQADVSNLSIQGNTPLQCGPPLGGDSLFVKDRTLLPNVDCFAVSERLEPLLWANPGTLDTLRFPAHVEVPFYLGALRREGPGRMAFFTTTLSRFAPASNPEARVENLMREIFATP